MHPHVTNAGQFRREQMADAMLIRTNLSDNVYNTDLFKLLQPTGHLTHQQI